tara:strand:- start:609 stop:944 length:336 start_codon:yes stop_codon:yes gene_type:complete
LFCGAPAARRRLLLAVPLVPLELVLELELELELELGACRFIVGGGILSVLVCVKITPTFRYPVNTQLVWVFRDLLGYRLRPKTRQNRLFSFCIFPEDNTTNTTHSATQHGY